MLFKLLLVFNLYNSYNSLPDIYFPDSLDVNMRWIQRMHENPNPIIFEKYYLTNVKFLDHCTGQDIPTGFLPSMFFTIRKDNSYFCIKFGYQSWDNTIFYRSLAERH